MKRFFIVLVAACFVFALAGGAMAVGPGKKVEWDEKTQGKVVFDGKSHADAGLKCNDCHTKIFKMKKSEHKMDDMRGGKGCGACHDGKKAFSVKADAKECAKCHKK